MSAASKRKRLAAFASTIALFFFLGCGGGDSDQGRRHSPGEGAGRSPQGGAGRGPGGMAAAEFEAAVPVEIQKVELASIASYIETHGTLEAENEVDVVARVAAPVVALSTEEGETVTRGKVLARLDDREIAARAEVSRVALKEAEQAFERAQKLAAGQLISPEELEQASTRFETAQAQYESDRIELGYTRIVAPFDGSVVRRYVHLAQQVAVNTPLFRLSDFDPLLCPIQIPERDLAKVRPGQEAHLLFEAWGDEEFAARVLRISPVVDAATGTVKVTLEVETDGRLRPGMFARVFVETERRGDALVIPKRALSLESIGDTVYVAEEGKAKRREVELGFTEGDRVEIVSGVAAGERVIVVGQDGLSEGTPVRVLAGEGGAAESGGAAVGTSGQSEPLAVEGRPLGPSGLDPGELTAERLEAIKARMRERGLSEAEIEERLERMKSGEWTPRPR